MKTGIELITEERQKQIAKHGFTAQYLVDNPQWYAGHQLRRAARLILSPKAVCNTPENWDKDWFEDLLNRLPKERLIIAGALIASELDRLELLEEKNK